MPYAILVIDPRQEEIAVREARKLGIPVVAVIDTDCDPDLVDYKVPGNDDAIRAIRLFCSAVADAVLEGKAIYEQSLVAQEKKAADEVAEPQAVPAEPVAAESPVLGES